MEVPSWAITDTIAVCAHVQTSGNSDWDTVAAALDKTAAVCALKWHVLYLAHQQDKLVNIPKAYTEWELGVLLRGCHAPEASTMSQRTCHKALSEWLPGRTAYGVKQAVKTHVIRNKRKTAAKLARYPKSLLGMLAAWPGPKQVLQTIQHTLLPDNIVAAQILAQIMLGGPASIDEPLSPVEACSAPPAESPAEADWPITEASVSTPAIDPATQAGSSSASPAPDASCLTYEAIESALFHTPEFNGSSSGSTLTMCHDTLGMASLAPFAAFSSSGSDPSTSPAVNPGYGFSWPVPCAAVAVGAYGVGSGPSPSQLQAANMSLISNYKPPCAAAANGALTAAVNGALTAAIRCSKFNQELHSMQQQQQQKASAKRKACWEPFDMCLASPSTPPAAGYASVDAGAVRGHHQPNKVHCSRSQYPCTADTVEVSQEQQQDLPLELKCAMPMWPNLEQSIQLTAMQYTAPDLFSSFQAGSAGSAASDSEAILHDFLGPTTPVAADYRLLTPDWLAAIHLAGCESATDPVQQLIDSPQLSECSTHTEVPALAAVQLTAAGGVLSEHQHNELLDLLPETPRQIGSQQAIAAVHPSSLHGKHPLQQQHGANVHAALAATAGAGVVCGCLTDADLDAVMCDMLAEPQEMVQRVELQQQQRHRQVQGNMYLTLVEEALQSLSGLGGEDGQLATLVSLDSLDCFLGEACDAWMQEL